MELSIFLAKWLGAYFIIVSLIAFFRKNHVIDVMEKISHSDAVIAFAGAISLLFGLFILIAHPVWEFNWRGLITLLGLLSVIQGILRFGFTKVLQRYFTSEKLERYYWIVFGVFFVLGLILVYFGFAQ